MADQYIRPEIVRYLSDAGFMLTEDGYFSFAPFGNLGIEITLEPQILASGMFALAVYLNQQLRLRTKVAVDVKPPDTPAQTPE